MRFNRIFIKEWCDWISKSPWAGDEFLVGRLPVGVSVRFGQDLTVCAPGTGEQQCNAWNRQRLWKKLRYVSVALATHIRAQLCESVEELPLEEVRTNVSRKGWKVYDSWDKSCRNEITDLGTYPCFNPDGQENRIYNDSGRRIPRINYLFDEEESSAGILVDLSEINALFGTESSHRGDCSSDCHVTLYPQAYIPRMGHVKANAIIRPFYGVMEKLNSAIKGLWDEVEGEGQVDEVTAISGVSCQFYNVLSHKLAPRAGSQEVQKGDQTAAMAGGYNHMSSTCRNRAEALHRYCETALPYRRHEELLDSQLGKTSTDLRAENVFLIDMYAIPIDHRTGRYYYI